MGKNKYKPTPQQIFGRLLYEHATMDDGEAMPLQGLYKPIEQYTDEDIVRVSVHNRPQFKAILEHVSLQRRISLLWMAAIR